VKLALRELTAPDIPRFAELERELFGVGAWSQPLIEAEVNGYGRWYLVAEDGDAAIIEPDGTLAVGLPLVVGYAGIWFDGDVSQVMTIGVDPNYRGQGVGRAMLSALIGQSIKLGAAEMFLEVAVDNEPALGLYRSVGFVPLAVRKRYYQPGNKDAYTMRLTLQ
jgi:ribosomal-protein-alanine N-acetyltransferase